MSKHCAYQFTVVRKISSAFAILILAITAHGIAYGQSLATNQITGVDDTTSTPVAGVPHDYITGLNEIVNPANGSLSVRIKAPTPRERGVNWPTYVFSYDSDGLYTLVPYGWQDPQANGDTELSGGAHLEQALPPSNGYPVTESTNIPTGNGTFVTDVCQVQSGYVFVDPDGGRHPLGLEIATPVSGGDDPCGHNHEGNNFTSGDSQYEAAIDPSTHALKIVDHHGNRVFIEDTNGNQYTGTSQQNSSTTQTPTGRQESFVYGTNSETMTFPGINGSYLYAATTATASNGSITIPYTLVYQGNGACQFNPISLYSGAPISFATSATLTLPNGQSYQFTFDPATHMLQKIVYPTGAYVEYTWAILPNQEGVGYKSPNQITTCGIRYGWFVITKRQVSYDGSGIDEEQDFNYTTTWPATGTLTSYEWTSKSTTVTTIDEKTGKSFDTVYTYSPIESPSTAMPYQAVLERGVMPQEQAIAYYADTTDQPSSLLKTITKSWQSINLLSGECVTLPNGHTSGAFYTYLLYTGFGSADQLLTDLPTDVAEYDYGQVTTPCVRPGSGVIPLRETKTTYETFGTTPLFPYPSILDRPATVQVYGNLNGTQTLESETDYQYDGSTLTDVANVVNHDSAYGVSNTVRGNPTKVTRVCTMSYASCSYDQSVTTYTYDITGQVVASKDANGNTTSYTYSDSAIAGDGTPPSGYVTDAFLSTITEPTVNGQTFTQNFTWGYNDGRMWSKTDENNQKSTFCYWINGCNGTSFDPFFRLTEADYPDSGYEKISYNDARPMVTVTTAINTGGTPVTETKATIYQAMGQNPVETQLQTDPVAIRKVYTYYDGLNRVSQTSNPYWGASDPTYGLTTYTYDALDRTTSIKHPDFTSQTMQYTNNSVLFTDEDGNQWQRTSDALGRLTQVLEPNGTTKTPTMETDYGYDALGNLTAVTQWGGPSGTPGARTRSFVYTGLSELRTSNNPEDGTIAYTYDANGNVLTKIDARTVKTTYGPYDALNRPAGVSHSDGTPSVAYTYDTSSISGNQYTKTRLTSATIMNGSNVISQVSPYNYDPMGRVQDIQECVPTSATACANRLLTYGYNQAGNVASMTNNAASPAFTLSSTYDGADQLSLVTSSLNTGNYPGTLFQANSTNQSAPSYGPVGLMNASLGIPQSGVPMATVNRTYDNRAQVTGETDMAGSQTVYYYSIPAYDKSNPSASGYDAAGNIVSMSDSVMGTWDYTYDTLNRLASASAIAGSYSSLAMSWTIDAFGNRTAQNVSGSPSQPVPQPWSAVMSSGNNNRIVHSSPPGANWTYDAGGDVTFDGTNYYLYDGAGRLCAAESPGTPPVMTGYLYDGNGNRIAKGTLTSFSCSLASSGFSLTDSYVVGKDGQQLTEFQGSTPVHTNVFAGGKLLATYANSQTYFAFSDWLGTKRAEIGASCTSTYASLPYGDELTPNGNCLDATEHHYTGKEHDQESGNDDFLARYYTSAAGRFLSPDWASDPTAVPYATFTDPQSLNLYQYEGNNPLAKADMDGHCCDAKTVEAIVNFLNAHPDIGRAASEIVGSLSIKVNAGIGLEESVGANELKASAALSSTGFYQFSNKGITMGSEFKYGVSINSPLTGKLSRGSTTETISKENGVDLPEPGIKEVSHDIGIGSFTNSEDTFSIGDETGAGVDLGGELDVDKAQFTNGINDFGKAISAAISQEVHRYVEQLQFSSKCTPSGCEMQ